SGRTADAVPLLSSPQRYFSSGMGVSPPAAFGHGRRSSTVGVRRWRTPLNSGRTADAVPLLSSPQR
ncbi:MAG: hypothetical protein ACKOUR_18940, partial [Planctomycetota bacterium]